VFAVPNDAPWRTAADLPEGVRISTEFPALTRRYLDSHGVKAVLSSRALLVKIKRDLENQVRGLLKTSVSTLARPDSGFSRYGRNWPINKLVLTHITPL